MFPDFFGNPGPAETLWTMTQTGRIPQTILLGGPKGVGKATLARRFAAELLQERARIEQDDLSLEDNQSRITERDKLPADKRNEDPLIFASNPDFLTFPPDGPMRQISLPQMRALKERAQYRPLKGRWRVFLIDQIDRANEQAANSLLKILEEPPEHLILILSAENPYDLLPTIRSRSVQLQMAPLSPGDMEAFLAKRRLDQTERRVALAEGSPGVAVSIDLAAYDKRRTAMLAFIESASGVSQFGSWVKHAEAVNAARSEKLDAYIDVLYVLIEDVVRLKHGLDQIRNPDIRTALTAVARRVEFQWFERALRELFDMEELMRRNIQKSIALDGLLVRLRQAA